MGFLHRTWAEINLDNLVNNFKIIRKATKDTAKVLSVVKADAYGHGAVEVARTLEREGTDWFAVSNLEEALQLRRAGIKKPILVLGTTPAEYAYVLAKNDVTQAVYSPEYAAELSHSAVTQKAVVKIHIKIDTGMHRIGFNADDENSIADAIKACKMDGFDVEGVFTHFASADKDGDEDGSFTRLQFERFMGAIAKIEASGVKFRIRHCCNSAAILTKPEMHLDMVRAGIILYGMMPSGEIRYDGFKPVMSLKSAVSMVKTVRAGEDISYGRTYTAANDITVATVPIGYADGYIRAFAKGRVLVDGRFAKIVGRICMDQMMIDITGQDVKLGDTVTLFGRDGDNSISVEELSKLANTINYETVCTLSKRITRVYSRNGRIVSMTNLLSVKEDNCNEDYQVF